MLKEINRICREMLFMHGHLTRPTDWAQNAEPERGQTLEARPAKRRSRSSTLIAAACCVVVPLVNVQIR